MQTHASLMLRPVSISAIMLGLWQKPMTDCQVTYTCRYSCLLEVRFEPNRRSSPRRIGGAVLQVQVGKSNLLTARIWVYTRWEEKGKVYSIASWSRQSLKHRPNVTEYYLHFYFFVILYGLHDWRFLECTCQCVGSMPMCTAASPLHHIYISTTEGLIFSGSLKS